ncbi:MAG TPA: DUF4082 domain-containing protein [Jiangellales bacterium]|nr:DUF4082 domain-containing protein [Jiangellales bacterium]
MARVRTPWTPPSTDGAAVVQAGVAVQPDVDISVSGVWWYQRTSGPATVRASLWSASGPTNLADSGNVSTAGFTSEAWNLIPFGSPVTLTGGGAYAAAVLVASSAAVGYDPDDLISGITSADGHVAFPANGGRFNSGSSFVYPASTWDGLHAVDVEYELASSAVAGPYTGPAPGLISPTGRWSPWTGVEGQAVTDVAAPAENAATTGTAGDATAAVAGNAEAAAGLSTANDPTAALGAVAGVATSTALAADPTAAAGANAGSAAAAAAGQDPNTAITVNAEAATVTSVAFDATVSTAAALNAPAELAAGSGIAGDATVALGASAAAASSIGSASDAAVGLAAFAELASVLAAAFDATVLVGGPGNAVAECATASAGAFDARVQKLIPRPFTGTTPRGDTGRTVRPFTGIEVRP